MRRGIVSDTTSAVQKPTIRGQTVGSWSIYDVNFNKKLMHINKELMSYLKIGLFKRDKMREEGKALVELYMMPQNFVGLILKADTGVVYSNQCGGTMCAHPTQEGLFVPLFNYRDENWADPFYDLWFTESHEPDRPVYSVSKVMELLENIGLDTALEPTDPATVEVCGEAWVPVRIRNDVKEVMGSMTGKYSRNYEVLRDLGGYEAILTYQNSD